MSEALSVGYIIQNRECLLREVDQRLAVVRDYVRSVVEEYATGLYLFGPPGTGKTFTVRKVLAENLTIHVYQRGHLTPLGLFELLAEHADLPIVLDDLTTIFRSDVALQVLLSALEHPAGEDRSRPVFYRRQGSEQQVLFKGGIICISNIELHKDALLDAFKSRVHTLRYCPSDAQLGAQMLRMADRGWPVDRPTISTKESHAITSFVIREMLRLECRFDLRILATKAFPLYQQAKDDETESDWRDLVTATIEEHLAKPKFADDARETPECRAARIAQECQLAQQIAKDYRTREERASVWTEKTGKSERAFYRRLAEIDNH